MQLRYACKWCSLQSKIMHTTTLHKECSEKCQSRVWTPMLSFLVCAHSSPITAGSAFAKTKLYPIACMKPEGQRGSKFQIHKLQSFGLLSLLTLHASQIAAGSMQPQQRWGFLRAPFAIFRLGSGRVATPAMRLHPHRKQESSASSFHYEMPKNKFPQNMREFFEFWFHLFFIGFPFFGLLLGSFFLSHTCRACLVSWEVSWKERRGSLEMSNGMQWRHLVHLTLHALDVSSSCKDLNVPERFDGTDGTSDGRRNSQRHPWHRGTLGIAPAKIASLPALGRLGTRGARVLEETSQNSKFPNEPEILNESFCILGIWPHLSRTGWKCQETWKRRMHQNHCIGWIQCFS